MDAGRSRMYSRSTKSPQASQVTSPTAPNHPSNNPGRRRGSSRAASLTLYLFVLVVLLGMLIVWRGSELRQRPHGTPATLFGPLGGDGSVLAHGVLPFLGSGGGSSSSPHERDTTRILAYLFPQRDAPKGEYNVTRVAAAVTASPVASDDMIGRHSAVVTLVIPIRGRLLPLTHITSPAVCRRTVPTDGAIIEPFTRVEVIFTATQRLSMDTVRSTLPMSKWESLLQRHSDGVTFASFLILEAWEWRVANANANTPRMMKDRIAPCVERVVVARVASRDNGLDAFVDPIERLLPAHVHRNVTKGAAWNVSEGVQRVVPLSQLTLAALALSTPLTSHFVLMAQTHVPVAFAERTKEASTSPSWLDRIMEPFLSSSQFLAGDDPHVAVASQAVVVQSNADADSPFVSLESQELGETGKAGKRNDKRGSPPAVVRSGAFERLAFTATMGALHLRVPLDRRNMTIVDKGMESGMGVDRQYQVPYSVRRLNGFSSTDKRSQTVDQVDMVSPYCTAFDTRAYLVSGGLHNDASSTFVNRILAGLFHHELQTRVLSLVKVRVALVERLMESISLVDVHKAGNVLRQQVRLAYSEVVESSNTWEDVTGKKFDRSLSVIAKSPALRVIYDAEVAAQTAFFQTDAAKKIEDRLAWQTQRLHVACKELVKLGKNKDSSATEEEIGWDLSLRLQRLDRRWRVYASTATSLMLKSWLPVELSLYHADNRLPLVHPSYTVDGRFQDDWGKAMQAMHRSRGGVPSRASTNLALREQALAQTPVTIFWSSFCCGCCGFSSEIVHFIFPLSRRRRVHIFNDEGCFCRGYPAAIQDTLKRLFMLQEHYLVQYRERNEIALWISHTDPGSYHQVVTEKRKPTYFVGRSMYEFSRIPLLWVEAIQKKADEVWVPCTFVRNVFRSSGVADEKLVVVPEAIDTHFFDPDAHEPIRLPFRVSKPRWRIYENYRLASDNAYEEHYRFYTNFKWEPRKGWEILLQAYREAFPRNPDTGAFPNVSLYIQTFFFYNAAVPKGFDVRNVSHILEQVRSWINTTWSPSTSLESDFPHVVIITEHVSEVEEVSLYRTMDAFVLPTRGEGWGLPTIQAMAMGMPAISTNWGGNTEFMTQNTSFLIPIDGLEEVPVDSMYKFEPGKKWAIPSRNATAALMRFCFDHPEFARRVGARARDDVHRRFGEDAVADIVDARVDAIRAIVDNRR